MSALAFVRLPRPRECPVSIHVVLGCRCPDGRCAAHEPRLDTRRSDPIHGPRGLAGHAGDQYAVVPGGGACGRKGCVSPRGRRESAVSFRVVGRFVGRGAARRKQGCNGDATLNSSAVIY